MKRIKTSLTDVTNKNKYYIVVYAAFLLSCAVFFFWYYKDNTFYKAKSTFTQGRIAINKPIKEINNTSKDRKDVKKIISKSMVPTTIVIPGRTMQSAVFTTVITDTLSLEGAKLTVPAGAMKQVDNLSITGLIAEDLPPIPAEITNVTKNHPGYRFLPHGILFNSAATIDLAYDATLIPEGYTSDDIYTYYFDESDSKWKALDRDSVDHKSGKIVSGTLHFTDMINGIVKVPESPETGGFTPTTIKDIKSADPAEGITFIEPPKANNEGGADISFPFRVPSARAGTEPQLNLKYSITGSSSWTGFGWNLAIPNITIDVSWGVPRYDPANESETYLLEGEQLTPIAHRSTYVKRTAERRFYRRIEGKFSKVIRHGNRPGNYWWEVTDKNGGRSFYGGLPETGLDSTAVCKDTRGNIGYWALTHTRDAHGNYTTYTYEKPSGGGEQLYISGISYNGNGNVPGPYRISFLRNSPENNFLRQDAQISCRLGFIQRDSALLRRVNITYNNETIRSYTLQYKEGAFFKTLLESITELDGTGRQFYSHRFGYFNDVQSEKGYIPYKDEKNLTLDDDKVKFPFINPIGKFVENVSALGGSASSGGGGKGTITIGPGSGAMKELSAGGGLGFNLLNGEELLTLVDIDGDGTTDKVYKKGKKVYYRPNLQTNKLFGDEHEIRGLDDIGTSETISIDAGPEASPPFSYVGYNHIRNKTKTKIYFTDFNGDGLIDISKKGVVYFNHIDTITHEPVFEPFSIRTPNPLKGNSNIDLSLLPDPAQEQAELEQRFPLHDAVRMWMAPYNGNITIKAPVQLMKDISPEALADTMKDGVMVSIQHEANVLWKTTIDTTNYNLINPPLLGVTVRKGDRIFFRVQSRFNGMYDKVTWDPEINYSNITDPNINSQTKLDVNGKRIDHFKASEDFIIKGEQSVVLSKEGKIRILSGLTKPLTSDTITAEILKIDSLNQKKILFSKSFSNNDIISNLKINIDTAVYRNDKLFFRITSSSNINWSKIKWNIYLKYLKFSDNTPDTTYDGKPIFEFYPVTEFTKMYNDPVRYVAPVAVDTSLFISLGLTKAAINLMPRTIVIKPIFRYNAIPLGLNDTMVLSVKTRSKLLGKKTYRLQNNSIAGNDSITTNIALGDSLFIEYHCVNRNYLASLNLASVSIKLDSIAIRNASVYYVKDPNNDIYGHLYRGWGQFDYDGNGVRANQGIILSELRLNDSGLNNNANNVSDSTSLNGQHNPVGDIFNVAVPYLKISGYMGVDQMVYISDFTMSSSRMGMKNVYVPPYNFSGAGSSGLQAVNKITIENADSYSAGISAGKLNVIGGYSRSNVYFQTDMADMNGDGYPDLLSENSIQYSGVLGGLQGSSVNHGLGPHRANAVAYGASSGGGGITAKCNNSMVTKIVKSDKKGTQKAQQNVQKSKGAQEAAKTSIGLSGSFSDNKDFNTETWLDINGDGLPDKVWNNGSVRLNLGYSFAPAEQWNFSAIREGTSTDYGLGGSLGLNYKNGSIVGGTGMSRTTNESTKAFLDVNGDGLPDVVDGNKVRFNTGSGFSQPITWNGLGAIDAGESYGENASVAFTISIPIWLIKLNINPSAGGGRGVSKNITQLSDMDGDGFPDVLYSDKESELKIKSSTINRTNMLKTVFRPMGGNFTVDYIQTPATYEHPGGAWALGYVKMFDGLTGDGVDSSLTTFEYENGFYNRHERTFYGFSKVKTHYHTTGPNDKIYRTLEQQYYTSDYYTKGMLLSETMLDGAGNKQSGSQNSYVLQDAFTGKILPATCAQNDSTSVFPALAETNNYTYLSSSSPQMTTRVTYEYDKWGNISKYTDYSGGKSEDKVDVAIEYHSNDSTYIHNVPSRQDVSTLNGLQRRRETNMNNFGDITQIRQYISEKVTANFDMEYDQYGNLTRITRPVNHKGERLWYAYQYDSVLHTLVTRISDAYGYSSTSSYNFKWGLPTENIDMNKQGLRYTYDVCGRQNTITGPYEIAANKDYTIQFEYHPESAVPYAHTLHYDSVHNANIETYTFADGLGRPVQIKKSAFLFTNANSDDTPGFIVSGKTLYDAFGRATHVYYPVFENASHPATYNPTPDNIKPTITTYNVLDSTIQTTLPDGSKTTHYYSIGKFNGENVLVDTITDALNHKNVIINNAKKRIVATIYKTSANDITTQFKYNAIGELVTVTDPKGNKIESEYDKLGRRISVYLPDAGMTKFFYDPVGNVYKKITANLLKQIPDTGVIKYNYDRERLVETVYPRNVQNRVNYTYGAPGSKHNRAGRIELVQDASGGQEFFYGPLGEVIKTIRTVQMGESDMRTWIWSAKYDTWNRIHTMIYPDGEKVTYSYNRAGNLNKINGEKLGQTYEYVSRIGYDKFDKQLFLQNGNGSTTTYSYEPERMRLSNMQVMSDNKLLMDNAYSYDFLSNILSIKNNASSIGEIGGTTSHAYSYDELNRLVQATGKFTGKDTGNYKLSMKYDVMGNVLHKTQDHYLNSKKQAATTYDFGYKYDGPKPNAASEVGDKIFKYDENGNLINWEDTISKDFRQICWDEENRIAMISDNGYINRYVYDADGERVIKSHGGSQGIYINGAAIGIMNHSFDNYSIYVSPYFVLQNTKFTKYYYIDNKRIAGKIGTGQFANQYRLGVFEITAGKVDYINRQQQISNSVVNYVDSLDVPPGPPTMKGIYADPLFTGKPYPDAGKPDTTTPRGWPMKPIFAPAGGPPGAPIQWGNEVTNDNVEAGFGFLGTGNFKEVLLYYYHSDHLGSTNYITDLKGNVAQFVTYMPFGETFAEQHGDWDSPFKFNAKEMDTETGLYYYGARYLSPKFSTWLSVDPLAEKDLRFSPYQYANNNPLTYIDPDGRTGKNVNEMAGLENHINNRGGFQRGAPAAQEHPNNVNNAVVVPSNRLASRAPGRLGANNAPNINNDAAQGGNQRVIEAPNNSNLQGRRQNNHCGFCDVVLQHQRIDNNMPDPHGQAVLNRANRLPQQDAGNFRWDNILSRIQNNDGNNLRLVPRPIRRVTRLGHQQSNFLNIGGNRYYIIGRASPLLY